MYVALTRARDRLYLSATVKDGVCRMGRGSLGEVLPAPIKARFAAAAANPIERPPERFARANSAVAPTDDFGPVA